MLPSQRNHALDRQILLTAPQHGRLWMPNKINIGRIQVHKKQAFRQSTIVYFSMFTQILTDLSFSRHQIFNEMLLEGNSRWNNSKLLI